MEAYALCWVAAVVCGLLLTVGCEASPSAGARAEPTGLAQPRAENERLARRVAELEVAVADLQRARRKPIDQPVVRTWIDRTGDPDGGTVFDLCVEFFAHGDFLDLLPNGLAVICRHVAVPATGPARAALGAFVTSADFDCWRQAKTDLPLPQCFR